MTSTEAMLYQLKQLKGKPLKQKLEHIVTYFWLPILLTAAILIATVSYIVHLVTLKEDALNVMCVNAVSYIEAEEAFMNEFAQSAGIDLDAYVVDMSTTLSVSTEALYNSYEAAQAMVAQLAAGSVDVMAADIDTLQPYFYGDFFYDLRDVLTADQQETYRAYYLYMDLAVMRELLDAVNEAPVYPDPTKPELMEEPVPIALLLPTDTEFAQLCYPNRENVALVLPGNTKQLENGLAFLDYILREE